MGGIWFNIETVKLATNFYKAVMVTLFFKELKHFKLSQIYIVRELLRKLIIAEIIVITKKIFKTAKNVNQNNSWNFENSKGINKTLFQIQIIQKKKNLNFKTFVLRKSKLLKTILQPF